MMSPMQDLGGVVLVAALIAAAIAVMLTAQVIHARGGRRLARPDFRGPVACRIAVSARGCAKRAPARKQLAPFP